MKIAEILDELLNADLDKLIIANRHLKTYPYQKGVVRLVLVQNELTYQLELFSDKQAFHFNLNKVMMVEKLLEMCPHFKQIDYYGKEYKALIKYKDINEVYFKKSKNIQVKEIVVAEQNRQKQYILKEGMEILALQDLGIFTSEGKIVNSKYEKYKQINRFIEIIDDVISNKEIKHLNIVDFGCGKSYLTFIVYHYLKYIKHIDVEMVGLDLKEEVIAKCNQLARKYQYDQLHFECGDIKDFKSDKSVDMVITLHACDIATDLALYHAIEWNTKMIFAVPCCQSELNQKIVTEEFSLLTKYGIIKERFSALATDALRAQLLEVCGYETQVIEFIDETNSLKNLLIRAVYKNRVDAKKKEKLLNEIESLEKCFNAKLMLHKLLESNKKM